MRAGQLSLMPGQDSRLHAETLVSHPALSMYVPGSRMERGSDDHPSCEQHSGSQRQRCPTSIKPYPNRSSVSHSGQILPHPTVGAATLSLSSRALRLVRTFSAHQLTWRHHLHPIAPRPRRFSALQVATQSDCAQIRGAE